MIDLPAAEPREATSESPMDPDEGLHGRVLVVEDNTLVRAALVQQLTGWGLIVDAVSDGEAALAAISETPFDAVLSDWRLPGQIDGAAVLHEARARLPHLKLGLLITGEDSPLLNQLKLEFPVLRKPLRPLRLRTLLARRLTSAQ